MSFVNSLLAWYQKNARELPWRFQVSAYRTWISEVMLQQTQVDTVMPYFEKWMETFPNIDALAAASEQDVLSVWEGLGYYSRARNIFKTAKQIVEQHDGDFPSSAKKLEKLPGIGRYTAAAMASIAFGEDIAAVDGNILRVLTRLFDVTEPVRSTEGEKKIWALAKEHLPKGQAGDYNQAMMDLGALVCAPTNPACDLCPVSAYCLAFKKGVQTQRPVRMPRKQVPHLTVAAGVIRKNGKVLIAKRPPKGLLGGLWEFPGGTLEENDQNLQACLAREIVEELGAEVSIEHAFGVYKHAYTHFKITLHAFLCSLIPGENPEPLECDDIAWVTVGELPAYPMGKVDRQIANRLQKESTHG